MNCTARWLGHEQRVPWVLRQIPSRTSDGGLNLKGGRHKTCGSGLAREGVVSVNINFSDPPLSRASPLPQGVGGG
ncbi:hypothetical protein C1X65_14485 [Pseudomonas sp. FW305-70]|nr:hypothetical protein C1X65_14485 [Pseudomonas sp. FW305-70]